jgi:hypothetical protein
VAYYKHQNNNYLKKKIQTCVDILNLHFKDYDIDGNQEISYENLKKCLLKENEIFSRKEIEIILKQINPEKNFEYWKFDEILKILYIENIDYSQIMKEDKIYNYLIKIFSKQDELNTKKLHYKKMKKALLIEEKLKLNKVQILTILQFFNIPNNPEIEYYKACLIIRDIIQELFSQEMASQKYEISQPDYQVYKPYQDNYDDYIKNIKNIFIKFDKDFDHLLNRDEFSDFILWLIPNMDDTYRRELFDQTDLDRDDKVSYLEFKGIFLKIMNITRYNVVVMEILKII